MPTAFCLLPTDFLLRSVRIHPFHYFEARVNHCVVAAEDRSRVVDTYCFEISHRTGASMFGRSRAIGDNQFVTRQLVRMLQDVCKGNQNCSFDMSSRVGCFAAHVNDESIVPRDFISHLRRRDARDAIARRSVCNGTGSAGTAEGTRRTSTGRRRGAATPAAGRG